MFQAELVGGEILQVDVVHEDTEGMLGRMRKLEVEGGRNRHGFTHVAKGYAIM